VRRVTDKARLILSPEMVEKVNWQIVSVVKKYNHIEINSGLYGGRVSVSFIAFHILSRNGKLAEMIAQHWQIVSWQIKQLDYILT
jgi:hypothetical protein